MFRALHHLDLYNRNKGIQTLKFMTMIKSQEKLGFKNIYAKTIFQIRQEYKICKRFQLRYILLVET